MLSKYFSADTNNYRPSTKDIQNSMSQLLDFFMKSGMNIQEIRPCSKGTLGISFYLTLNNKNLFVKTYNNDQQHILKKEVAVLNYLYGEIFNVNLININKCFYLTMPLLSDINYDIKIEQIIKIIKNYSNKLNAMDSNLLCGFPFTTDDIISASIEALSFMFDNSILDLGTVNRLEDAVNNFNLLFINNPKVLCHGDLSNKNIMKYNAEYIVIDWEDIFWGVNGYDFAYWLTFFDQRKYYKSHVLQSMNKGGYLNLDIMLCVILLKCRMDYKTGKYLTNKLSSQERLNEIFFFFNY